MIVDDIRNSIGINIKRSVFSYGRSYDTAISTAKIEIDQWFVFIDPIFYSGEVIDGTKTAPVFIGFIKQDKPDSEFDTEQNKDSFESIEQVQEEAQEVALTWLEYFRENYNYQVGAWSISPVTRVKNVMSGVVMQVSFSYKVNDCTC